LDFYGSHDKVVWSRALGISIYKIDKIGIRRALPITKIEIKK